MMRINLNTSWYKESMAKLKGLTWRDILVRGVNYFKGLPKRQKIITSVIAGCILIGGTIFTTHYVTNLNTIYRVYVDGKEIGVINNGPELEDWLDNQIDSTRKQYPNLYVRFDKKVNYKKEAEYKGSTNNKAVYEYLNKNVHVQANATALYVDGKVVAYVSDQKTIDKTINYLKSLYSGKPVARADGVLTASTNNQPVAAGQTGSLPGDPFVTIKEDVQTVATNISPKNVLNDGQLLQLLQKGALESKKYTIQSGDTVSTIAKKFSITQSQLLSLNPQMSEVIKPGQVITVQALKPKITILTELQEDANEVMSCPVEVKSDSSMYKGEERIINSGTNGQRKVKYFVIKENGIVASKKVLKEEIINQPVKRVIVRGTKVKSDRGTGSFRMPASGYISSGFGMRNGRFHKGIDIAGGYGSAIVASDNGRVVFAGWDSGGYGNCIIVDHGNGIRTRYAHMCRLNVSVGTVVQKGQVMGGMGATGDADGVHLHFEVLVSGTPVNPLKYLR